MEPPSGLLEARGLKSGCRSNGHTAKNEMYDVQAFRRMGRSCGRLPLLKWRRLQTGRACLQKMSAEEHNSWDLCSVQAWGLDLLYDCVANTKSVRQQCRPTLSAHGGQANTVCSVFLVIQMTLLR